jgi:hypothetical protein
MKNIRFGLKILGPATPGIKQKAISVWFIRTTYGDYESERFWTIFSCVDFWVNIYSKPTHGTGNFGERSLIQ